MESACVGIYARVVDVSENERVSVLSFLIQKQRVCKYRTKHFPCCNLFVLYSLIFSAPTRFSPFIKKNKYQVMFSFRLKASTWSLLQVLVQIFFRNVYLASAAFDLFPLPCFFKSFASSFQIFPCSVKFVAVENAFFRTFLTSSFCREIR